MSMLVLLAVLLTVVLGASALVVLWPLTAVAVAILYCVDRPVRRRVWPVLSAVLIAAGVGYRFAPWDVPSGLVATLIVVLAPLLAAGLVVAACGGPRRVRARHERAEFRRRLIREAAVAERRQARKAAVRRTTGLDVDVVGGLARRHAGRVRGLGERLNRRLERRRPARGEAAGWLDLDEDVSARLAGRRRPGR